MSDPLAGWWRHRVTLRRAVGRSGFGGVAYGADEVALPCYVSDRTELVAGPNDQVVTSNSRVAFPSAVGFVPVDSQVDLPVVFGGRTARVVASSVADGGGQPTPDHVVVYVD